MEGMFADTSYFDQNLGMWDVSKVTTKIRKLAKPKRRAQTNAAGLSESRT